MKILDSNELAGFIKERQASQVRSLRQAAQVIPKLSIVQATDGKSSGRNTQSAQEYAADIAIEVDVHQVPLQEIAAKIDALNQDVSVHGISVQAPSDTSNSVDVYNKVSADKDVEGLVDGTGFDAPTAVAVQWLLAGYNVNLQGKNIVIASDGRPDGRLLAELFRESELVVTTVGYEEKTFASIIANADVLVTMLGLPGQITQQMVKPEAIIIDVGNDASGTYVGNVSSDVRQLSSISITPETIGLGELRVCALFENVIHAARV